MKTSTMLSQKIRREFLRYFEERGHTIVPSAPVVPHGDPTLLFNNAGMNQFKDVFLGESVRDYTRAATTQKCIRAGGKHNDLDNVGHTTRHLTLFEMLGNFSFGDYFKAEAIEFAWEVSTQIFGFDKKDLWVTVFREDDQAAELWTKYFPEDRICRFDEKDNFWAMGDTGPCGPCTELHLDRGPKFGSARTPHEDESGERYIEFWNLVFMESNRLPGGIVEPLPKPSIDTGAGLERVVSLMMGVENVFETDILRSLIGEVEKLSGIPYNPEKPDQAAAFNVIADHLRCLSFAIADGAQPSNVDRGYVLRKVLRRAVRYGRTLGLDEPFLAQVLPRLVDTMGEDFRELVSAQNRIAEILTIEEESFLRTLKRGGNILNQIIEEAHTQGRTITGEEAFKLKDTYGFPLEEILLIAKDSDLKVDTKQYEELESEARERSRAVHKTTQQVAGESLFADLTPTEFVGYSESTSEGKVIALVSDGKLVDTLNADQEGIVVLDRSPFYAEMGGQVGDTGSLKGEEQHFTVNDCQAPFKGITAHVGKMHKGTLKVGDTLTATINTERRQRIANNHTVTHIMHWALHRVLGEHIKQAGSVVAPDRLRFDFSHHKGLSDEEIHEIETLVNDKIRQNLAVQSYELSFAEAQKNEQIKQFFGDKYGNIVRVVDIDFSKELCGGTHTSHLGNIGLFRISKEGSIAAGIRRIEAVTGAEAEHFARQGELELLHLANLLKTQPKKLPGRIEKLLEENKQLTQELKDAKHAQLGQQIQALLSQVETINDIPFLAVELPISPGELRPCAEQAMSKLKSGVLVLGAAAGDKCHILAKVSDDLVKKGVNANELIKAIAPLIEGSGGGKPNNAQAGGKSPQGLKTALERAREFLRGNA